MSFLSHTVLPGSTRLHKAGGGKNGDGKKVDQNQGNSSVLAPLFHLVKDPVGTISGTLGHLSLAYGEDAAINPDSDRKQVLYLRMKNAESYEEWKDAATELDTLEGNDAWKHEDESTEYDVALVAARLKELDDARINCDVKKMLFLVRTALTRGLGGMGDLRLYKHSHVGTKALIERYIDSAQKTMTALLDVSAKQGDKCPVTPRVLVEQLLATRQSFGRSALLLSGGGTFGMNHIGVVKSLWEARLLPRIISGASAGSIVCAVLCTKTDEEIPSVLRDFCYGDLAVFEREGVDDHLITKVARFLKYGSLFDISHLARVMRNLLGDITFQESYNRTRRILNITVSSASLYELPRLLNYVTAPNVMIWSAVCASCSVPFVFSPASLLAKDPKTGGEVPWNPTPNVGWIDGSVDNDLPMNRLAEMFNVNHFIVSQVNPHVVPFLEKEEENISAQAQQNSAVSASSTWMTNATSLAKGEALHRLHMLSELGIFPNYLTKARSVLNQRYSGDITIFPAISYADFPNVLSNPTTEYMLGCMLTGERATWPKLARIQNHVSIELALDDTIRQLRARVVFSPSQVDLRLNNFSRPVSQGNDRRVNRSKPTSKTLRFNPETAPSSPTFSRRAHPRLKFTLQNVPIANPSFPIQPQEEFAKTLESRQASSSALDVISSSNADESSERDYFGEAESDTSDIFSSPSPPDSPTYIPALWPSTRQILFPSSSQPSTPTAASGNLDRRNGSLLNLTMTPAAAPSAPEVRYKRLFHPSKPTSPELRPIRLDIQQGIDETIQPLSETATLNKTEKVPETQKNPPSILYPTDSPPVQHIEAIETAAFSTVPSPANTVIKSKSNSSRRASKVDILDSKETERLPGSRRGSLHGAGLGLILDISGTRGMFLRKKSSRSGSFVT